MSQEGIIDALRFEIVDTGEIIVVKPANDDSYSETYFHNLGYIPAVIAYADIRFTDEPPEDGLRLQTPYLQFASDGTLDYMASVIDITDDQLEFNIKTKNSGAFYAGEFHVYFRYYLLREVAD